MKKSLINSLFILLLITTVTWQINAQPQGKKTEIKEQKADFKVKEIPFKKNPKSKQKAEIIPNSYIFILKDKVVPSFMSKQKSSKRKYTDREAKAKAFDAHQKATKKEVMKIAKERFGIAPGMVDQVFTGSVVGFSVKSAARSTSGSFAKKAQAAPELLGFGNDFFYEIDAMPSTSPEPEPDAALVLAQSPSWGTNYTGWTDKTGSAYWAWILDTGIDGDHPDLNVKTSFGKSTVGYTTSSEDDHGHGTHCAGIVAAKNNSIGTRGVAAGAWVVPVKVCTSGGRCSWSDVLEGLEHVSRYSIAKDVVNMSLGMTPPSWWDELWNLDPAEAEDEIKSLAASGVYFAVAAGNDNAHASSKSPARINVSRVYTVSAMNWNYDIASFSNYGNPPVDYAAPGVSIRSCHLNGGYATMSGTSMAAPYVAGILLANGGTINSSRRLRTDKDSTKDRIAIK